MFSAAENLQLLKNELGDQAHLFQYAPVHRVFIKTLPVDSDLLAVSFKIYLGQIRENNTTRYPRTTNKNFGYISILPQSLGADLRYSFKYATQTAAMSANTTATPLEKDFPPVPQLLAFQQEQMVKVQASSACKVLLGEAGGNKQ